MHTGQAKFLWHSQKPHLFGGVFKIPAPIPAASVDHAVVPSKAGKSTNRQISGGAEKEECKALPNNIARMMRREKSKFY